MGVRFSGTFKPYIDDGSEEVSVQVIDIQGGGDLPIRIEDLRMFSESEAREPLATIRGARCELTFLIEDENYEAFINELAQQVEDRYYIVCSAKGYQFFVGVVVYEFIEYEDISYPFGFTLNAVDGLTRMKDIDYLDEDGEPYNDNAEGTYLSALDHIINCFSKLNLEQIYDQTYDTKRIWIQCNWYATNMLNTSDNPLEMLYVNSDVFYEEDNDGEIIANSCYEVLENILKALGLTITYGRGIYRIDQYSSRAPNAAFYWNYQLDGTPSGTRTQSWSTSITKDDNWVATPKAGGRFSFLPPLRQVKVRYEYGLDAVAVEPDEEYGFGTSFIGGSGTTHKVCYLVPAGNDYNAGWLKPFGDFNVLEEYNPIKFRVHYQLMIRLTYDGQAIDYIPFKIVFRIWLGVFHSELGASLGYKTYSRQLAVFGYNNIVPQKEQWLDGGVNEQGGDINLGGYDYVTAPYPNPGSENTSTKYYDVGFETLAYGEPDDPIDVTSIKPFVCVGVVDIISEDGNTIGSDYQIEYAISDLTVIYAESNNRAKPTIETVDYTSTINEGGRDSITIDTKIGDRGNTIKVFNGSKLVAPDGWGIGGGGSQELGQLLADEYHGIRGKPIRLMTRTVIGRDNNRIDNLTAFDYCDLYWLSLHTEHNLYSQEISGMWWNHTGSYAKPPTAVSRTRKSYSRYNRLDEPLDASVIGGRLEARGRDGAGFTAPTTKFIITDWTLPTKADYPGAQGESDLNRMLDVFINGDKLEYVHTIPGSQGNTYFTIDNSDNSIVVSANFPLSARHWIQVYLENG